MAFNAEALRRKIAERSGNASQPVGGNLSGQNSEESASASGATSLPDAGFDPRHRKRTKRDSGAYRREDAGLPHSEEAERGVLASILVSEGKILPEVGRFLPSKYFFYVPAHVTIYEALSDMWDGGHGIDLITFTQFLRDKGVLEAVGGVGYISDLIGFVPTAANVQYYTDIVREKFLLREMIAAGTAMTRAAHGNSEDVTGVIDSFTSRLERIKRAAGGPNGAERFDFGKLMAFDSKADPNCLVGHRYIVRGGSSLWAGGSGYGKSSLAMQLAVYWACGVPFCGLRPARPLKSLLIQAENDEGDMAEQLQGVIAGIQMVGDLDIEASRALIEQNIGMYRAVGKTGDQFIRLCDDLIDCDKPDIVWPDPLFAFAGCDLLNAEKTGRFLREGLFPLAAKRKVAFNVMHHVGKPVRDKDAPVLSEIDYQYLGFGSSEIQNAFRAVNILLPVAGTPGVFRLVLSKRGERAGAKDHEGNWARSIYLKHATEGICWLQTEKPEKQTTGAAKLKYTGDDILEEMRIGHDMTADELQKHLNAETGMSRSTFFRLWKDLKKDGKVRVNSDNKWSKKPKLQEPE